MENLADVIDQILEIVPRRNNILRSRLTSVKDSVTFAAPELAHMHWTRLRNVLSSEIPSPFHKWELDILEIWEGIED